MARNNVQMIRLKRMFQLLAAGTPRRAICKRLKIGGGTLWKYEQATQSQNLSFDDVCKLSDTDIEGLICTTKVPKEPSTQRRELDGLIPVIGNLKCSKIGNKSTVFQEDKYLSLW